MVARPSVIPSGSWPRRMAIELAAAYCGEPDTRAFMRRVGNEYPPPRVNERRRKLWLKDDLDRVLAPDDPLGVRDAAEDL